MFFEFSTFFSKSAIIRLKNWWAWCSEKIVFFKIGRIKSHWDHTFFSKKISYINDSKLILRKESWKPQNVKKHYCKKHRHCERTKIYMNHHDVTLMCNFNPRPFFWLLFGREKFWGKVHGTILDKLCKIGARLLMQSIIFYNRSWFY